MQGKAIQDHYAEPGCHCYGCGTANPQGLHLKSYWEGEEAVCRFTPRPYHTGIPGFAYGGLLASVIDCHATAAAAAAACRAEGHELGAVPLSRFVTGRLAVDFLRPTPIGHPLEARARVTLLRGRKAAVAISIISNGQERARGEVVAVRMPPHWGLGEAA